MTCEMDLKTPPMEWYAGIAFPGEGIKMVGINTRMLSTLHWEMYESMSAWLQTRVGKDRPDFRSSEDIKTHQDTGAFIQKITGFTPEVLMEYGQGLGGIYEGQSMGPFPFPVTWITR